MSAHEGYSHAEKGSVVSIMTNGLLFVFKIVAGVVIMIGSLVLDGSLKNKVEEQTKKAAH